MSRAPTSPSRTPEAARADGRQQPRLLVGAQHDRHPARRLLERLEQRRLGVLVHPVGALDDRDPGTALDRHQRELRDQVTDAPVPGLGSADDDLAAGPAGPSRWRSGWPPRSTSRQPGTPGTAGRRARPCTAARPRGRARASSCRPRPGRRAGRRGAPAPRIMAADRAERGRCPRVRAPSMARRSGGRRPVPSLAGRAPLRRGGRGVVPRRPRRCALAAAGLRVARGLAGAFAARRSSRDRSRAVGPAHRSAACARPRPARPRRLPTSPAASPPTPTGFAAVAAVLRVGAALGRRLDAPARRSRRTRPRLVRRVDSTVPAGARWPARRRLLGDLGPEHRLELGRDVAPRLVRARRRAPAPAGRRRGRTSASSRGGARRTGPAADVGVAVDAAATAAAAVALAIHGRLVGRPAAAGAAPADPDRRPGSRRGAARRSGTPGSPARRSPRRRPAARGRRRCRGRRAELRVPDRPERVVRGPRGAARRVVLLVVLVVDVAAGGAGPARRRPGRGAASALLGAGPPRRRPRPRPRPRPPRRRRRRGSSPSSIRATSVAVRPPRVGDRSRRRRGRRG